MPGRRAARGGTLILGGGFAGSYVARLLGRAGATIVSRENFMLYTPLLPEAASGSLEPRHVVVPLRQMCRHAELLLGAVQALDEYERTIVVGTGSGELVLGYEQLVVALGAVARTAPVPGLVEHAVGFKDLADAISLRNHVLRRLEAAITASEQESLERELGFVFVGAGYAGVEALAELHDLVHDALRFYPALRDARQRWVLVDAAPTILPEIPHGLGRYASEQLVRREIDIHVETTLASYDGSVATLSDGTTVPTRTLVWTAGARASPLLADLGLPLDERGRVLVDGTLRVQGRENVWAVGECAAPPGRMNARDRSPRSARPLTKSCATPFRATACARARRRRDRRRARRGRAPRPS